MKQLVICAVALVAVALTACQDKKDNGKLDPNAMIALNGVEAKSTMAANAERLTPLEVVKYATVICYWNRALQSTHIERGFSEGQRDETNVRLLMFSTDIIGQYGTYEPDFIESEDVILVKGIEFPELIIDTIAYVPNKVLRDAQKVIKAAYDEGDYATCYAIFNEAFTFIPITGKEWLELKAKGKN